MTRAIRSFRDPLTARDISSIRAGTFRADASVREVVASGRAHCRACGERITRGDRAIELIHDFSGCSNARLLSIGYVHSLECGASRQSLPSPSL